MLKNKHTPMCKANTIALESGSLGPIIRHLSTILLDFSLTVKAATLIFISGCGPAISSTKEGKSDFIYNLIKS